MIRTESAHVGSISTQKAEKGSSLPSEQREATRLFRFSHGMGAVWVAGGAVSMDSFYRLSPHSFDLHIKESILILNGTSKRTDRVHELRIERIDDAAHRHHSRLHCVHVCEALKGGLVESASILCDVLGYIQPIRLTPFFHTENSRPF